MLVVITAQDCREEAHLQKLQPLLWCEELPASLLVATVDFGVLGVKRHFGDPDVFQRLECCLKDYAQETHARKVGRKERNGSWQEKSMPIRVRIGGEDMVQRGDGTDDMVSGSEDGAELPSRIGKFHPGPLQACVSLAGPCLSSVLQLSAVQGALGSLPIQ